jgi:ribose transport system ATP-binding protein
VGRPQRLKKPVLEARSIRKVFPGVVALDDVSMDVAAGEVVALVGENGAGKSTLMKLLAGLHQPDQGEVLLDGEVVQIDSVVDAVKHGIALIHQELSLCDNLTIAAAMFLGAEIKRGPFLCEQEMADVSRTWLTRLGLEIDPQALVSSLRLGQRQLLEIARALRANARVLIMDEPTSSLTQAEADRLFDVVRELRADGRAIIYITHRLAEIAMVADRVVGLRDGRNSGSLSKNEISHDKMVKLMVGREIAPTQRKSLALVDVALSVQGLRTQMFPQASIDLDVLHGEIVGVAGLLGSGRSELLRALFGVDRRLDGDVHVGQAAIRTGDPGHASDCGLVLLPEDRKAEGLILDQSVAENLSLPTLRRRGWWLDRAYEGVLATESIAELGIACRGADQASGSLSGGNQQKVVLGKWLAADPVVLLLDEPTRGVDVGARSEIYRRLNELAKDGRAILFVSSDLEEVLSLADRVLVMRDGNIAGELLGEDRTEERVMMLATGATSKPTDLPDSAPTRSSSSPNDPASS